MKRTSDIHRKLLLAACAHYAIEHGWEGLLKLIAEVKREARNEAFLISITNLGPTVEQNVLSFDSNDDGVNINFVVDPAPQPLDSAILRSTSCLLECLLKGTLTRKQAAVVRLRFGLGCHEHTMPQIVKIRGSTQQNILRTLNAALKKLRNKLIAEGLSDMRHFL
jgi:hypothetical protein